MVKYICDKCANEVSRLHNFTETTDAVTLDGTVVASWKRTIYELCDSCNELYDRLDLSIEDFMKTPMEELILLDNSFKVGDEVITSTGKVGVITDICTCNFCKERGFYEPTVETTTGDGTIRITDNDKRVNFASFYKIGNNVYGNIDEDSLSYEMNSVDKEIKDLVKRKKALCEQRQVLNELKQDQDDQDEFDWLM